MPVVNSKERLLDMSTVMATATNDVPSNLPLQVSLVAIAKETSMPNVDVVQFGNTVFIGHVGKNKNKSKMVGRPLNIDTGRNFINNVLQYISYLQEKGITHYSSEFEGDVLVPAIKVIQRKLIDTDTNMYLGKKIDNKYIVLLKIGEESLMEKYGSDI